MPQIKLTTSIAAPLEVVFDLSRSIDVHQISMQQSDERAIGGITSGLIQKDENSNLARQGIFCEKGN